MTFCAVGQDDVLGLEAGLDVHAELALGQVADVSHRRDDLVVAPEVFVDRLRLRRRFDDDQCLCHLRFLILLASRPVLYIGSRSVKPHKTSARRPGDAAGDFEQASDSARHLGGRTAAFCGQLVDADRLAHADATCLNSIDRTLLIDSTAWSGSP